MMISPEPKNFIDRWIYFCLHNKVIAILLLALMLLAGLLVSPFDWNMSSIPRYPVPVDALPDRGENQQIVFTEWPGRSPQDVENQVSSPLTVSLLGVPGVKSIRSYSNFGYSVIYVIFDEDKDFYWSRTRVNEKLNSLPPGTLPEGVFAKMGPDATALGQVFWYTLEGRDESGAPTGGWDLDELRSIQDWQVKYALLSAGGISEVASVGGYVKEYQIDIDPDAMRAHGVNVEDVYKAVKMSNTDVGARSIEMNGVEYIIRGLGFVKNLDDIRKAVIKSKAHAPITIDQIAKVSFGPALRRGALDKAGAEAVGGVVVARFGENPMQAIKNIKDKIKKISSSLPKKTLEDGRVSQVTIVPFYDRSGLIQETLGTLESAINEEILVTVIVILLMLFHLRSALLISGILPLAVLLSFVGMKAFDIPANIVALSGIAIAIGTIVDMGVVLCENILRHLKAASKEDKSIDLVFKACQEVSSAIFTAVITTTISFLPILTMSGARGKLFQPLAYTKTFALIASIIIALTMIPPLAHLLFTMDVKNEKRKSFLHGLLFSAGLMFVVFGYGLLGGLIAIYAFVWVLKSQLPETYQKPLSYFPIILCACYAMFGLASHWLPLGPEEGEWRNFIFILLIFSFILGIFWLFEKGYTRLLHFCLEYKILFLSLPSFMIIIGLWIWFGFTNAFFFLPDSVHQSKMGRALAHTLPGLSEEFMPPLDEGSYLYMPMTSSNASISEAMDAMQKIDMAIASIPEVQSAVGKLGRAETSLDSAPISMIETIVNYHPEYKSDESGRYLTFEYDEEKRAFVRDDAGKLIQDPEGRVYRNWRPEIKREQDIWDEIVRVAKVPGTSSAPKLQPIAARNVMLLSGMRAPIGVKVWGEDLESIEKASLQIEKLLKEVDSVEASTVLADRMVGKPYLEIHINRKAIARYGIHVQTVQHVIETAVGGKEITYSVEGRERYPIRIRYQRERRDSYEELKDILVPSPDGTQIPLQLLADIHYVRGPMSIKSENTSLVGYVVLDKKEGFSEIDVVRACEKYLKEKEDSKELVLPEGVRYSFAGEYQHSIEFKKQLKLVIPFSMFLIFFVLYLQFKSVAKSLFVFSGIFVAWAGGFIMIWLCWHDSFLSFNLMGVPLRELFSLYGFNLSAAVWVGFLALFGIASDDGVLMLSYIKQHFKEERPQSVEAIRIATIEAAKRRIRPCMMTVSTTIIALLPVLASTGRGADIMIPMAIPVFGGMLFSMITVFVVPTLNCLAEELKFKFSKTSK